MTLNDTFTAQICSKIVLSMINDNEIIKYKLSLKGQNIIKS